ncbi:MAG: hypothetical protein FWC43_07730 [Planctomycetaceae bacterium]|nr:hypothetical protein [Planctomycetaceae bacterium]
MLSKVSRRNFFLILAWAIFFVAPLENDLFGQSQSTLPSSQHVPVRQAVPPRNPQENAGIPEQPSVFTQTMVPNFVQPDTENPRQPSPSAALQQRQTPQFIPQNGPPQSKTLTFPVVNSGPPTNFVRQVNYQNDETPPAGGVLQLPSVKTPEIPKNAVTQSLSLQNLNAPDFTKKLLEKLGSRCVPVINVQTPGNVSHFQMVTAGNTLLDLVIDNQGNTVRITGSKSSVDSFARIAQMLDSKSGTPESYTDMVPFHGINYRTVQQTVNAIQQNQERPGDRPVGKRPDPTATILDAAGPLNQLAQEGVLLGPVQIEVLEGLDYVVIKGNRRDVDIVRKLIDQIERTGAEQEPTLVIHPLKHADSTRIGTLVRLLYNEIYGTRRGSLNITSLVKPNALLLVGKKESIDTAIELVEKLDFEVDPNHRFKIVRLKWVSSATAESMLTGFFQNPDQMDTAVKVIRDDRTNSLILQGSERDVLQAMAMIEKIDVDESASVNEFRMFQLLNANASTLATTLQNALIGTTTGSGGSFTPQGGSDARRTMLEFRGLDARDGEMLRSGIMTSDVRITAETNGNLLLVNAPANSMPLIEAIIKELDQIPAVQSKIDVYTIINGDASSLYTMLQNLFQTTTGAGVGGVGGVGGNSIIQAMPGLVEGESAMVQLRFYYDVRTNSIIAIGSEGNLAMVEALLMRLDEASLQNRIMTTFRLLNSPATQVATSLNQLLTQERQIEMIDPNLFSVFEQFHREVIVVPDTITNCLIVSATPRFYNDIRRIITELDRRPPMVAIQVLVAEVTLTNMNEFGVEFGLQDAVLFDRGAGFNFNKLFSTPASNNPVNNVNSSTVGTQGLTNLNVGRTGENGYGGFVFSASSESVSVLLRALEERNKVEVLSRPQIVALDNQRASLQVGQNMPYVGQTLYSSTGVPQNSVQFISVGVILDVTPRISSDGLVVMSIYAEKSTAKMDEIETGRRAPLVSLSTVQSVVSAMDGQTIVIGGLITNETNQVTRAVPFLSRIPVVGRLFEYNSNKCERKEILVIMTPMIVRSEEDMEIIRNREQQRIHWCVSDVMSISDARNVRTRGDYYSPVETQVVPFNGYVPDSQLQMLGEPNNMELPVPMLPGN